MSDHVWSFDELAASLSTDDPEVRYWAIDRLTRHFPERACDRIAPHLLDEHELTPQVVARHLGEHGGASHQPMLVRGFRMLRGVTPGLCFRALVQLGDPGVVELAEAALKRDELSETALAAIVEALAEHGSAEAHELVRKLLARRVGLLAEPAGMRGVLRVVAVDELPDVLATFLTALQWRGSHRASEAIRSLMDALELDDASWCFHTGPGGHIELRKTIKAVESGYDCDIAARIGAETIDRIGRRIRDGDLRAIVRAIAGWTVEAAPTLPADERSDLPRRIAAAAGAFMRQDLLDEVERLGGHVPEWLLGFQLSAAFAVARGRNVELSLRAARGDLDALLELAELETAFLLPELPGAIAVVCRDDERAARRAQDWCLRMLEARGPFFPKVVALDTLGELRAVHFVDEVIDYLADESAHVYGAAERALGAMGEALIPPAVARIESGTLDPDSAHSVLVLLCELGTSAAMETVTRHLDYFMDVVGPGSAAEWVSLFGAEGLIEPLRDWLDDDPAMVGQALLLLGAIHDVAIPEEDEILRAIADARARHGESLDDDAELDDGPEPEGGGYVM